MPDVLKWILCGVIGYALGNFTMGIPIARLFGKLDIRKTGSKNVGATNVLRTLGWGPSVLTLIGDALKGVIGVLIGRWLGGIYGGYIAGILVVLGHNWPALHGFKGGKGIATSFGVILTLQPFIALGLLLFEIAVVAITKYMSVASMLSAVVFFAAMLIVKWGDWVEIAFAFILSALAVFSHRANIGRLLAHQENKLDFKQINKIGKKSK